MEKWDFKFNDTPYSAICHKIWRTLFINILFWLKYLVLKLPVPVFNCLLLFSRIGVLWSYIQPFQYTVGWRTTKI